MEVCDFTADLDCIHLYIQSAAKPDKRTLYDKVGGHPIPSSIEPATNTDTLPQVWDLHLVKQTGDDGTCLLYIDR